MILLISTCSDRLSEEEFVRPVSQITGTNHIRHYRSLNDGEIEAARRIIICGTALMDNDYLYDVRYFEWLKTISKPVLGICSGMQLLGLAYGARLVKQKEIGLTRIKTVKKASLLDGEFEAYCLHGNGLDGLDEFEVLALSGEYVQAIKHKTKPLYGMMFHPEVRNRSILENFARGKND